MNETSSVNFAYPVGAFVSLIVTVYSLLGPVIANLSTTISPFASVLYSYDVFGINSFPASSLIDKVNLAFANVIFVLNGFLINFYLKEPSG